jgi:hypothetical protein
MTKPTGFHVRHDFQPGFAYELLLLLHASSEGQTEEKLHDTAHNQGFELCQRKSYDKLLKSLNELGLIERHEKKIVLTTIGQIVSEVALFQNPLLPEIIHFLYYTLFDSEKDMRFSWSYQTVCQYLWTTAPCTINRDHLVNVVVQKAASCFGENSISFSTQSVMGVLYWVESLSPACLDKLGKVFSRRIYCPIETFALALHHVYERHRGEGISLLLTPEIRQEICMICLIIPEVFQDMLDQAEMSFDCIQVRRERGERLIMTGFNWDFLKE